MFILPLFILLVASAQIAPVVARNETYVLQVKPFRISFRFAARQDVCPAYVFYTNEQKLDRLTIP
jgi:hypothetical protein